jgi:hypothetical protein
MQKPGAGVGGNRVELREYTLSTTGSESVWPIVSGSYENSWEKRRAKWWLRTVVRGGIYLRCGAIRVLWGEERCVSRDSERTATMDTNSSSRGGTGRRDV